MTSIEEYLSLPYTMTVRWEADDDLFVARVAEIEGCTAHGITEVEALQKLRDSLHDWVQFALDQGIEVPQPGRVEDLPSGKWLQRVPRSLHKKLIERAAFEGVSLNAYVTSALSMALGSQQADSEDRITSVEKLSLNAAAVDSYSRGYLSQVVCPTSRFERDTRRPEPARPFLFVTGQRKRVRNAPNRNSGNAASYRAFLESVSERIPNHETRPLERTRRESAKENLETRAYA